MAIIINFTKSASELDTEDFRMLLEDLKSRFHFNWFVQGNDSHTGKPMETSNPSIATSNVGVLDNPEETGTKLTPFNQEILNNMGDKKK